MTRLLATLFVLSTLTASAMGNDGRDVRGLQAYLLERQFSTYAKTNEICYIAFGCTVDTNTYDRVYTDPPEAFLKRYEGRAYTVKRASEYPKVDRTDLNNILFADENPQTDIPNGIYTVEIVEWIDDTTARVKCSMYRASLRAAGYEAVAEKKGGTWRIKKRGTMWVS